MLLGFNLNDNKNKYKISIPKEILDTCESNIRESTLEYFDKNFKEFSIVKLSDITSQEVSIYWLFELYVLLHSCEVWSVHGSWVESIKSELGPIANYNFNHIAKLANREILSEGIKKREWFAEKIQTYLKNDTLLCFPTTPEIAPKKGLYSQKPEARTSGDYFQRLIGINAIAGLSRSPQITIPINDFNGMPIGISFLAPQNQDELLLKTMSNFFSG